MHCVAFFSFIKMHHVHHGCYTVQCTLGKNVGTAFLNKRRRDHPLLNVCSRVVDSGNELLLCLHGISRFNKL